MAPIIKEEFQKNTVATAKDLDGTLCALRRSSVDSNLIWVGKPEYSAWLQISREQVAELLPFLQCFAETGEIIEP